MNTNSSALRRIGATLAIAGIAAFGSVAIAPAASAAPNVAAAPAAQDGPLKVLDREGKGGPDAFIQLEHGRVAVFFCDEDKPKKHAKKCEAVVVDAPRF
jgi:hypothetical protein